MAEAAMRPAPPSHLADLMDPIRRAFIDRCKACGGNELFAGRIARKVADDVGTTDLASAVELAHAYLSDDDIRRAILEIYGELEGS